MSFLSVNEFGTSILNLYLAAFFPSPKNAVILAFPELTAVSIPVSLSTDTTDGFEDFHEVALALVIPSKKVSPFAVVPGFRILFFFATGFSMLMITVSSSAVLYTEYNLDKAHQVHREVMNMGEDSSLFLNPQFA